MKQLELESPGHAFPHATGARCKIASSIVRGTEDAAKYLELASGFYFDRQAGSVERLSHLREALA